MQITWLGWAGVELAHDDGSTVVIDPLDDAGAVFRPLGGDDGAAPAVVAPRAGAAVAGLVTHLHRDHADAPALAAALRPDGVVLEPPHAGGTPGAPRTDPDAPPLDDLALVQADIELTRAGLARRAVEPWSTVEVGPFAITALPAVDGAGDPQVSWLVEADGVRVVHLGDTMWHAWWWRIARFAGSVDVALVPACGATLTLPHRTPDNVFPSVLDPEHAAAAAEALGADLAVPIHAEGYDLDGVYAPVPDATARFAALASDRGVAVHVPTLGAPLRVRPAAPVAGA